MEIGHKLTEHMLDEINYILIEDRTYFRVKWDQGTGYIALTGDIYFDSKSEQLVRPNEKFYNRLESLLSSRYGLTNVSYNNTKTTFWCIQ